MVLEANVHARVHDAFWRKSRRYRMTLKSNACASYPWIIFARPTDSTANLSPRESPANKSLQPWMRSLAISLLVLVELWHRLVCR